MTKPIFILNGPNLNRLGAREPAIYGRDTLDDIRAACEERAGSFGYGVDFRQSNAESELVDWVQTAGDEGAAIVINPAAYGHTSVALHDALKMVDAPVIEVHLSVPAAREEFRAHSYVTSVANGVVSGLGAMSYVLGVEAACRLAGQGSE